MSVSAPLARFLLFLWGFSLLIYHLMPSGIWGGVQVWPWLDQFPCEIPWVSVAFAFFGGHSKFYHNFSGFGVWGGILSLCASVHKFKGRHLGLFLVIQDVIQDPGRGSPGASLVAPVESCPAS